VSKGKKTQQDPWLGTDCQPFSDCSALRRLSQDFQLNMIGIKEYNIAVANGCP
jgi:hypothetical protein